ncbi:NAD(P)H-dependent flavin oxidoreductase [Myxococcus landrumensis]|uniref:Propionate 3-nitronate monooxygenase n=1 Tax=Myxococcus landrumensis TaxID=2813577 RepID=A0ABX7N3Z0_9BACT|nr:nitronate monooxygenase [Myxococcus landrumus]QSQ13149.1 nitronate monooxygenase [Myxococcus landrumus]
MWTETRVTRTLGVRLPLVQGPFGGGMSSTKLAAAVSEAGGLGSFGANHLNGAGIEATIRELRGLTSRPFSINLWVPLEGERELRPSPEEFQASVERLKPWFDELGVPLPAYPAAFAPDYEEQVEAVLAMRPAVFSFIFGVPSARILEACRARGIITVGTATHVAEGLALDQAGVDLIVASGSEAGGHRACFLRPVEEAPATTALVPQLVDQVRTPVIASGGIADGRSVATALALGAEGVQVGTAFLACEESNASEAYRRALRNPETSRATALTRVFSGRYARGIRNRFMKELTPLERDIPPYPIQNWLTQPMRQAASRQGREDLMSLWAGQNAPLIRHSRAAELVDFLEQDTTRVLGRLAAL